MPTKRRRKWDVAADGTSGQPPPPTTTPVNSNFNHHNGTNQPDKPPPPPDDKILDSVQLAKLKAERIQAQLADTVEKVENERVSMKVDINDSDKRQVLTRGKVQEEIVEATNKAINSSSSGGSSGKVLLVTKGRYQPPSATTTTTDERLHLYLEADSQRHLDIAYTKIKAIMDGSNTVSTDHSCKLYATLPNQDPRTYSLAKGKILGRKGQFVRHIENKARVKVQLRGKGSGFREGSTYVESDEPLHLYITAYNESALKKGKDLAEQLLEHVKKELFVQPPPPSQPPPPQHYPPYAQANYNAQAYSNTQTYGQQYNTQGYTSNAYQGAYGYSQGQYAYGATAQYPNNQPTGYASVPPPQNAYSQQPQQPLQPQLPQQPNQYTAVPPTNEVAQPSGTATTSSGTTERRKFSEYPTTATAYNDDGSALPTTKRQKLNNDNTYSANNSSNYGPQLPHPGESYQQLPEPSNGTATPQ